MNTLGYSDLLFWGTGLCRSARGAYPDQKGPVRTRRGAVRALLGTTGPSRPYQGRLLWNMGLKAFRLHVDMGFSRYES